MQNSQKQTTGGLTVAFHCFNAVSPQHTQMFSHEWNFLKRLTGFHVN